MFYSKKMNGFLNPVINHIPDDAVELTKDEYRALLDGVSQGKAISVTAEGQVALLDRPPLTPEQIKAAKIAVVQRRLDEGAQAYGYDYISTAVTYADEPAEPKFQAEGQALRAWRSKCWAKCWAILAEVHAGTREIPTDTELIAEMPLLELPAAK